MTAENPADAVTERAARAMHDAYEAAAVQEGWETQRRSRVAWEDVPEANKRTMYAALRALSDAGLLADPADRDEHGYKGTDADGSLVGKLLARAERAEAERDKLRADYAALVNSQLLTRYAGGERP